jgi:hypothetical protein
MATNPATRLRHKFGSNADIAAHFSVTREAIRLWMKYGIPADRALEVEEATQGDIKAREVLHFARQRRAA